MKAVLVTSKECRVGGAEDSSALGAVIFHFLPIRNMEVHLILFCSSSCLEKGVGVCDLG